MLEENHWPKGESVKLRGVFKELRAAWYCQSIKYKVVNDRVEAGEGGKESHGEPFLPS